MLNYEIFAKVYDEVMDDSLYQKWQEFTFRYLGSRKTILELACGSGKLAVLFAQRNLQVTGVDYSEEMLSLAEQRGAAENVAVEWIQGDMLNLSQIGTFEVVTCFSDSICYMKNASQVQQVFDGVAHVLVSDGMFLFDVHSLYQIDEVFPRASYHVNEEDFSFLWDSFEGEEPHSVVHELTFFVRDETTSEMFVRKDELHYERTYPLECYRKMLENAGFTDIQVTADFTQEAPRKNSNRWFFVCRKG